MKPKHREVVDPSVASCCVVRDGTLCWGRSVMQKNLKTRVFPWPLSPTFPLYNSERTPGNFYTWSVKQTRVTRVVGGPWFLRNVSMSKQLLVWVISCVSESFASLFLNIFYRFEKGKLNEEVQKFTNFGLSSLLTNLLPICFSQPVLGKEKCKLVSGP